MGRRLSPQKRAQIVELAEAGETQIAIARAVSCSPETVRRHAERAGIIFKLNLWAVVPPPTSEDLQQILDAAGTVDLDELLEGSSRIADALARSNRADPDGSRNASTPD